MARQMPEPRRPDQMGGRDIAKFADVLDPQDAVEPILSPSVRLALFEWLTEIRAADDLSKVGVKPRRTNLLYGPPGCGKTTLAHHFAARLGLPLACVKSESLVDSHLGGTGRNFGRLFDAMAKTAGSMVIFFDEIDAIGGRRMDGQSCDVERAAALTVLLRRIEAFDGIALAATNRQDFLDEALWRRFDIQVAVDLPGQDERFAIISRYLSPYSLDEDDVDTLATLTAGASPALLRGVMESVKRTLVLAPRINRPVEDPQTVLGPILSSVAPPPDFGQTPPLWTEAGFRHLSLPSWPPQPPTDQGGQGR